MAPSELYVRGDLTIDHVQRLVIVADEPVRRTSVEYDLLVELAAEEGMESGKAGEPAGAAHPPDAAAPQAGRKCRQPQVHIRRAQGGLLDAGGGDGGAGEDVGVSGRIAEAHLNLLLSVIACFEMSHNLQVGIEQPLMV